MHEFFCLGGEAQSLMRESFCLRGQAQSLMRESLCLGGQARGLVHESFCLGAEAQSLVHESFCLGAEAQSLMRESFCLDGRLRTAITLDHSSRVKPTFRVTCQWATLPSTTCPRTSVTWNQRISRMDLEARSIAVRMASSLLCLDEPVNSRDL